MAEDFDLIWQGLRATRWDPPAAASASKERRRTYVAALEQAEQLMRAAASVGPAVSPLLLFYGLSQAGRAIAAAAADLTGPDWQLSGHGILIRPMGSLVGRLAEITTVTDGRGSRGSFTRLSELLGSPLWPKDGGHGPMRLEPVWDCIPECHDLPLSENLRARRKALKVELHELYPSSVRQVPTPVGPLPGWVLDAEDAHAALEDYLSAFVLGERSPIPYVLASDGGPPEFTRYGGWGEVEMNWQPPKDWPRDFTGRISYLESFTRRYCGGRFLFPAITGEGKAMHPLMAWWTVLFVLSMLARYEPARWGAHIAVDSSRHAVPLERILGQARAIVPRVVAETLQEVSG